MRLSDSRRLLISTMALLCVLQAIIGAGIVVGASTSPSAEVVAQQTSTPTNNTTVQQENPDDVDESGDTEALRSHLSQSLADRLGESAVSISQEEYERGQSLLGDGYDSTLEKYVDVAGGADSEAEIFQQAAENQRQLANSTQEYNETYQAYQAARNARNTTHARDLARELERLATETNGSAQRLAASYTQIENVSGADLSAAEQSAINTSDEIRQRHQQVVSETFVRTTLSVRIDDATASFADPASVRGEIVLANGTALQNETVDIRVGEQIETVQTDGNGAFTFDYRPVTVPNGTDNVSIAYRPAPTSIYLGSNATLNMTIKQITADLSVTAEPASVNFGDNVTVTGWARANGTAVAGARVQASVDGATLGTTTTGPNGTYNVTAKLPASVPSGDESVSAVVIPGDRAVRSEPSLASLRVASTATSLSVNATQENDSRIRLAGRLVTADERAVAGQPVELRIDGATVATVETRANGSFSRTVTPPAGRSGTVTVRAVYDEPSSNLNASTAQTSVELGPAGGSEESDQRPLSPALLAGGGIVVLSLLAIGWLVRRDEEAPAPAQPTATATSSTEVPAAESISAGEDAAALLANGQSDAAIQALYAAVRRSIQTNDDAQTHWEFYTTASDHLAPEAAETLERLTEAYERVVYSPRSLDQQTVATLIDDAESLFGEGEASTADL